MRLMAELRQAYDRLYLSTMPQYKVWTVWYNAPAATAGVTGECVCVS